MKKRLLWLIILVVLIVGCENIKNTPTSKVESFLSKYQRMDTDVIADLENTIEKDTTMNQNQKKEYQALLEKQYQNLSYKIKNEEMISDSLAIVEVEIEVLDYQTAIKNAKKYYQTHPEEFHNSENTEEENEKYIDYKIDELKKVTTKSKQEITFQLEKKKEQWILDELSSTDLEKIHGLY